MPRRVFLRSDGRLCYHLCQHMIYRNNSVKVNAHMDIFIFIVILVALFGLMTGAICFLSKDPNIKKYAVLIALGSIMVLLVSGIVLKTAAF